MNSDRVRFQSEVREWSGPAAWFFILLPVDVADAIAEKEQTFTTLWLRPRVSRTQ